MPDVRCDDKKAYGKGLHCIGRGEFDSVVV